MAKNMYRSFVRLMKENTRIRELLLYLVFLILFSVVTFSSKPGEVQFFLNSYHGTSMSEGIPDVTTAEQLYTWLDTTFADKVFPTKHATTGEVLDTLERLYISGDHARVIGAMRLRQVRSKTRQCVVPTYLQTVNGQQIVCVQEYSMFKRQKTPIYPASSTEFKALDTVNFTEPFEYRSASALNSTSLYGLGGRFGTYGQDGYNLDIVPNVAPNVLAAYVSWCRPAMINAIEKCRLDQGMSSISAVDGIQAAQATPTPTPNSAASGNLGRRLLQTGGADPAGQAAGGAQFTNCAEDEDIEVYLQNVDTSQCRLVPDPAGVCQLHYVGFQLMRELMRTTADAEEADSLGCRNCKCQGDVHPSCAETCSPKKLFRKQVATLQEASWIDNQQTRAVMVDVSLFNQNSNLFTSFRGLFEMPTFGGIQGRYDVNTFRIHRYVSNWDTVVMGLEIVFVVFILFYTLQELREIIKDKWKYFKDPWNILDWANLLILYVVIGLRLGTLFLAENFVVTSATIRYVDITPMGSFATQELNISALNFFLLYFKVFKYLRHMPRMDAILVTISSAATDLAMFIIMSGIVLVGFAAAFYVCFGMSVSEYRSIGDAFGSLIQALLGEFDYQDLSDANSVMAPLLFYLYFAVVFFVLLSMFIAILDDSYGAAKDQQTEEDLNYYKTLYKKAMMNLTGALGKRKAVHNLAQDLLNADSGETVDGLLDEKELEAVLAKNPKALKLLRSTNVKQLIEKYDINSDGMLDKAELMDMIQQLIENEGSLEDDIKGAQGSDEPKLPEGVAQLQHEIGNVQNKVLMVDGQIRDLGRNTAKKLGLMIDLMMSLSDQISTTRHTTMLPGTVTTRPAGGGGAGGQQGFIGM